MCLVDNRSPNVRIAEWIRFHRNVGASLFVVFDDIPLKVSKRENGRLADEVLFDALGGAAAHVVHRATRKHFEQNREVMPACARVAQAHGALWMVHLDVDEFSYPMEPHLNLHAALGSHNTHSMCVLLPRLAFGAGEHGRFGKTGTPKEVVRTFDTRAPFPLTEQAWAHLLLAKHPPINLSTIPMGQFVMSGPIFHIPDHTALGKVAVHIPSFFSNQTSPGHEELYMLMHTIYRKGTDWKNAILERSGQLCASPNASLIRVNHYVGSFAEFLKRVNKPTDAHGRRFSPMYPAQFDVRDLNTVTDTYAMRWAPKAFSKPDPCVSNSRVSHTHLHALAQRKLCLQSSGYF